MDNPKNKDYDICYGLPANVGDHTHCNEGICCVDHEAQHGPDA